MMWSTNDKCMAPFSEDGKYYRATIQSITTDCQGNKRAKVKFSGYTSDESETVDVTRLKKRTVRTQHRRTTGNTSSTTTASSCSDGGGTGFSSPLNRYMPEHDRLRDKFSDLLDTVSDNSPLIVSKSPRESSQSSVKSSAQKRKYAVAIGGHVKQSPNLVSSNTIKKTVSIQPPVTHLEDNQSYDDVSSFDRNEGFSSGELERPYFPNSTNVGPKIPFVLSEPDVDPVVQIPATINRYLRDYQREGVKFLYQHYIKDAGAILGDDMGLGKTVQVLAFLCAVLGKTGTKEDCQRRLPAFIQKQMKSSSSPSHHSTDVYLIICPSAVLYNWLDEFETWTYCTTGKYHGKDRGETLLKAMKGKLDAVLTTYETYRLYIDELHKVKWTAVIVDEVHKIKAPKAKITIALKEVNTLRRYGLTGTALQNQMTELWCVLDWANPGCLGDSKSFWFEFQSIINRGQTYDASKRALAEGRQTSLRFSRLRSKWMLRRTKALISHQLPTKEEKVVFCKMTDLQLSVYRALLDSDDLQLVLRQNELCDCGSDLSRVKCCYVRNAKGFKVKALTFSFMALLTKVSNHVALLTPTDKTSDLQRDTIQTYCDIAFARHPQFVQLSKESKFCTLSDPKYCGKMQVLDRLLNVFRQDNSKVLIFSHYTTLLDILEMYLKTTDWSYRRLDGSTQAQDRQKYVHEFNRDKDIFLFLISTKAGGVGLNLTGANKVIIYDPNWNPTYDLQAQDRAYRIGQHRDVSVYRLISTGTIEENMYLRQVYKQQIASVAMESENAKRFFTGVAGGKSGELFGLKNMFELRTGDCILTKDLIERESKTVKGVTMAKYVPVTPPESDDNKNPSKSNNDEDIDESDGHQDDDDDDSEDDDVHGIVSQLMISEESDIEEVDNRLDEPREVLKDNGKVQSKQPRGKSIVHKNGRVESRVKGRRPLAKTAHDDTSMDSEEEEVENKPGEPGRRTNVEKSRKKNIQSVDDVLKECGVSYVHSNKRLVGSSKVEDHVSNAAIRDVFELDQHSQQPANYNVPTLDESLGSENTDREKEDQSLSAVYNSHNLPSSQSKPLSYKVGSTTVLIGQTPRGIRRRQFKELASSSGFASTTEFARHILSSSLEDQMMMLKNNYTEKNPGIEEQIKTYFELTEEKDEPKSKVPPRVSRAAKSSKKAGNVGKGGRRQVGQRDRRKPAVKRVRKRPQPKGFYFDSESEEESEEEKCNEEEEENCERTDIGKVETLNEPEISMLSDVEDMDMSDDSNEQRDDLKAVARKFTDLRQDQPSVKSGKKFTDSIEKLSGSEKLRERTTEKRDPIEDKPEISTPSSKYVEQNMSFLDDIFLTSSDSKKVRKPPPKKKQSPRKLSPRQPPNLDTLWGDDEPESSTKDDDVSDGDDEESEQSISVLGIDSQNTLWKRNSKYGHKDLDTAALEKDSVFHKYSSSFVVNKNYKRKLYRFDADKDEILSETLSEDGS